MLWILRLVSQAPGCKDKIEKEVVRVGKSFETKDGTTMKQYYHAECFFMKAMKSMRAFKATAVTELAGFDTLKPEDQAAMTKL